MPVFPRGSGKVLGGSGSRSSAYWIPDNDKVRDSAKVINPPLFFVLYNALGGLLCKR